MLKQHLTRNFQIMFVYTRAYTIFIAQEYKKNRSFYECKVYIFGKFFTICQAHFIWSIYWVEYSVWNFVFNEFWFKKSHFFFHSLHSVEMAFRICHCNALIKSKLKRREKKTKSKNRDFVWKEIEIVSICDLQSSQRLQTDSLNTWYVLVALDF